MPKKHILRVAIPTPLRRLFDYYPPQDIDSTSLRPGIRVRVPFQSRRLVGILVEVAKKSDVPEEKLKSALAILDDGPLFSPDVFALCQWAARYYHYALGEILAAALPVLLRKGKLLADFSKYPHFASVSDEPSLSLNAAQQQAVTSIASATNTFRVFLLDGVTGSGKTEVYLQTIALTLAQHKQILILVPEISLTPQTIARFRARFSVPMVALHSSLSETERAEGWLAARSGLAKIVIGTRSAIFTSFANLGLIIVDEEHDGSFKQQDRFRYHARDLAIWRARQIHIPIVLGSATPSLETLLNVKRKRYHYLSLPERAGRAQLPRYQIVDVRAAELDQGLSAPLLILMREHLNQHNQVMLFLNRRGFAPVLMCTQCHWMALCKRCDARLVYHRAPTRLQCHHCDAQHSIPTHCEPCQADDLQTIGLGTQRIEQALGKYFPGVPVIRVDRDNTRKKNALGDLLERIHQEKSAILLGTQMLAKGHHFPQVTLVGMIDADSGLLSADYRAVEQMGQLLVQVAGRAGRAEKSGVVAIQTRYPDHPALQLLLTKGYGAFAQTLFAEREVAKLPPFTYLAIFRAEAHVIEHAHDFLTTLKEVACKETSITLWGPVAAPLAKRKGLHRVHLLVKAEHRGLLQQFLRTMLADIEKMAHVHRVRWTLDVDPVDAF